MFDLRGQVFQAVRIPLISAFLLGSAFALSPALAQDGTAAAPAEAPAVTPDTVVATVGDETITEGDIAFAAEDLQQQLQSIPPAEQKAYLVTILIDMKLIAGAAREAGMDQTDLFKQRLEYLSERSLWRAYFAEKLAAAVTEEAITAAYNQFLAGYQPEEEVHARHILVATKEDADAVVAELATGKAFEDLAKEKSTDPSAAQNGGDLGFFRRGQMVKPFEDAAFALEVGQLSAPVESQFGWHVIKVEEKRASAPPTIQQLAPQLQQQVIAQAYDGLLSPLKAKLPVSIADPALAAAVAQQSEPGGQ